MRPELMEAILQSMNSSSLQSVSVENGVLTATDNVAAVQIPCGASSGLYSAKHCAIEASKSSYMHKNVDFGEIRLVDDRYPDVDKAFSLHEEDYRVHLDAYRLRDLCDIAIAAASCDENPQIALVLNKPYGSLRERWVTLYFENDKGDFGRMLLSPIRYNGKPFHFKQKKQLQDYNSFAPEECFSPRG